MKYLVLDTNIPLSDASNLITLGQDPDVTIVLPETVLAELDEKKSGYEEVNWQARETARLLAAAKFQEVTTTEYGNITTLLLNKQTILIVSLNKYVANPLDYGGNDQRIIEVAKVLSDTAKSEDEVILMSIDFYMRIRAQAIGLNTLDFKIINDVDFEFVKEMDVTDAELFRTLHDTSIDVVNKEHKVEHYSYKFLNPETGQIKLATITNGIIKVLGKDTEKLLRTQDCAPINSEQLLVSKAIQDPMIDLILIEGLAGSGKNVVAISNAIRLLKTSKDKYNGIIYIRTPQNDEEPGEEIGFLATNEAKYGMYLGPMEDTIDFIVRQKIKPKSGDRRGDLEDRVEEEIERMMDECGIEATISTGLRGKTFHNKIVILDEWQNSAQATAQKVLTRIGKDCKTIVIGSQRQIDSKYVTKYNNGLAVLMGEARDRNITTNINMFAIELSKVVRSDMALFAEDLYTSTKGR